MKEKIEKCFERLQSLNIQPTLGNMEKLVQTLYDLREVYNEIVAKEDAENARAEDGPAADPDGRDDH